MLNDSNDSNSLPKTLKKCPKCNFNRHYKNALACDICLVSLIEEKFPPAPPELVERKEDGGNRFKQWHLKKCLRLNYFNVLARANFLYILVSLGLILLVPSCFSLLSNKLAKNWEPPSKQIVASGILSYGGDAFFATLVANGLNQMVQSKYPYLQSRYVKPLNQDFSSVEGIDMLTNGELSVAFNARPLTDDEYAKAQSRGVKLKQTPIAIDSIAIFSNLWTPASKLNLQQVRQIFKGEITNWNQINSKYESLPITPIIIKNENYDALNLGNFPTAIKVANYTEALRQVISSPGAISFASVSLVQNQRLVKIYSLSDNDRSYVKPFTNSKLNSEAVLNGTYPLSRRLFIVYREDSTNDQLVGKVMTDLITSPPGHNLLKRSNFVPIF